MIHITHVVAHPPFREGIGTTCYYNVRSLIALGCQATIYAPRIGISSADQLHLDYSFMPVMLSLGNAYLTPHILAIPVKKTHLIHLHYPFIFGAELTTIKTTLNKKPLVITYHNDLIGNGVRKIAFWFYNRLNAPWVLKQARKIIVTSYDYATTSIYASTIFRERKNDLVEIHNGVDETTFYPEVNCSFVRPRYRLSSSDFVLLFVSSLDRSHARKGLDTLLDTLAEINDHALKLIIVGDGDMRAEYEKYARQKKLQERVYFAGRVPQNELPAHYAACDVVCIPSRPPEAFGLALAQGMAMAKPVIGSDIPGVRTLVGECGVLIPPGDRRALVESILRLRDDPALRRQLGERARARILERYTWHRVGERLLALYRQVLETA